MNSLAKVSFLRETGGVPEYCKDVIAEAEGMQSKWPDPLDRARTRAKSQQAASVAMEWAAA